MQSLTEAPFGIVKPQSFYTVQGVMLPNGSYGDLQVTQNLLDGGRSRTPAGWRDYRNETGWGPGSAPLQFALHNALYNHRSAEGVEELRQILSNDFRKYWMATATGINPYRAGALDVVVHDSGTPEERTLEARLVGPDGRLNESMGEAVQALFGGADVRNVRDVYLWITGKESHLWRLNVQPKQSDVRALVLGGSGFYVDFGVNADGLIVFGPARGVRSAPQNSTGSKG